jgi:translation initiation factor 1
MPKKSRKTKVEENSGDLSIGGEKNFSLSIGEALGRKSPGGDIAATKNEKPESSGQQRVKPESPETVEKPIREAILRRESAGRGGRTVTVVDVRPPLDADAAMNLAKNMRKGLGCGSHVEGGRIILQGDIGDRAEAWLAKNGVKKIVRGN